MAKIIIMRGLPASGKTTKAKELMKEYGNFFRLNKDDLRAMMLGGGKWDYKKEKVILKAQTGIVEALLKAKINLIIDDTNLNDRHIERWRNIANENRVKFEIVDVKTDVWTCIKRDELRKNSVGREVILGMALRYKLWKPENPVLLCDIDGTLADIEHRRHFVKEGEKDWKSFNEAIPKDKLRLEVWKEVLDAKKRVNCELILVSGRNSDYREETEDWLNFHLKGLEEITAIFMRGSHDHRADTEVKKDFLDMIGKENIFMVFDDRPSVIRMWRENGVKVVDVGDGVEF